MKKLGYSDNTLKTYLSRLKLLAKHLDLGRPEEVKEFIAKQRKWSNSFEEGVVKRTRIMWILTIIGWDRPKYKVEEACKLVEAGFEYVTEMDGVKLFRKLWPPYSPLIFGRECILAG